MSKYLSILLAAIGLTFAIYWVKVSARKPVAAPPLNEPAQSSFVRTIAGAGIIESTGRNINLAPPIPGQVVEIFVKENDKVKAGDALYRIDDSEIRSKLASATAEIARAESALATARADVATQIAAEKSAMANVEQARAQLADAEQIASSNEKIYRDGVLPYLTYNSSLKNRDAAAARLEQAQAQLTQAKAQIESAKARVSEAEAQLQLLRMRRNELEVTLKRLTVRAPQSGRILQVNIRVGEIVSSTPTIPPLLFGETEKLQVRVDIDEVNASRIIPGRTAVAHLKGDADKKIPLEFVRIDPYILPKKSLTGDNTERVDVRVLQVIYSFDPPQFPVYVGQQVDVFIDMNESK